MTTFTHKGHGRIYCEFESDIPKIKDIIKEIDEYESGYMPNDLITTYENYPRVVYLHKFSDIETNKIASRCWEAGIKVWIFDSGREEFPTK